MPMPMPAPTRAAAQPLARVAPPARALQTAQGPWLRSLPASRCRTTTTTPAQRATRGPRRCRPTTAPRGATRSRRRRRSHRRARLPTAGSVGRAGRARHRVRARARRRPCAMLPGCTTCLLTSPRPLAATSGPRHEANPALPRPVQRRRHWPPSPPAPARRPVLQPSRRTSWSPARSPRQAPRRAPVRRRAAPASASVRAASAARAGRQHLGCGLVDDAHVGHRLAAGVGAEQRAVAQQVDAARHAAAASSWMRRRRRRSNGSAPLQPGHLQAVLDVLRGLAPRSSASRW